MTKEMIAERECKRFFPLIKNENKDEKKKLPFATVKNHEEHAGYQGFIWQTN